MSFFTKITFFITLCFSFSMKAAEIPKANSDSQSPPLEGNFILPFYQQLKPFVGFGQNITKKAGTWAFALSPTNWQNTEGYAADIDTAILYALTEDSSILVNLPAAMGLKKRSAKSAGLEDMLIQGEYAFLSNKTFEWTQQATIVAAVTFPTGSPLKHPPTGFGSSTVFLGATYNRTYVNWYGFISPGVLLTTPYNHVKPANVFLYQAGLGRNLFDIGTDWIFAWVTEMDGFYSSKDKVNAVFDPDSGRSAIYITNSLWIACNSAGFVLQLAGGVPVIQQKQGKKPRETYMLGLTIGKFF